MMPLRGTWQLPEARRCTITFGFGSSPVEVAAIKHSILTGPSQSSRMPGQLLAARSSTLG